MKVENYQKTSTGIVLETTNGKFQLQCYAENMIRIRYTLGDFSNKESLMVTGKPSGSAEWKIDDTETAIMFSTKKVKLLINKETAAFTYLDGAGNLLVKEPKRGGKTLVPIDVMKTVHDEKAELKVERGVDGIRVKTEALRQIVDRQAYHTKLEFEWDKGEALYGLGSHEEGIMNLRGHHQYLYQQNMKAVMPFFISTKGYGILMDNYSLMTFHDDVYGSYIWTDIADELDFYFIYGENFDHIIQGYRGLTGKAPLLPRWSYGYVQSKERYVSQEEIVSVATEYRKRNIPLDAIVLDWKYWPGDFWGQKSFDSTRFPDPSGMVESLHQMNVHMMVSIWPIMNNNGPNQEEMLAKGFMLPNKVTYDAFNEQARELYWQQANEGLFSHGIDAWWCDCTEPFESDWNGEIKPEPEERLKINTEEAKKYLDPAYINAYSLQHAKGIYEGQRRTNSGKRVVNLTRSSYAGQQRYATITWSGDVAANWQTLKRQIPAGLNFCAAGAPYWTTDIGAFFAGKKDFWFWNGDYNEGCKDLGYCELYVRWFQYGCFLPMFRAHGTDTPREVWQFGEAGSMMYDILIQFIRLRYRLFPYIYSVAGAVTHEDYTLLRMLAFDFAGDEITHSIDDQYMFGPAIMVNPVTTAMYYDSGSTVIEGTKRTRQVYLPAGCDWYDFWTGEGVSGGQDVEAAATLELLPLYVRAGSIIPLGPDVQYADETLGGPMELRIYKGQSGRFTLYEDEGDNYNYEQNACSRINITWDNEHNRLTFAERIGCFDGMINVRCFKVIIVSQGHGVGSAITETPDATVEYDGRKIVVDII